MEQATAPCLSAFTVGPQGIAVHRPQDRSCWLSATLWESTALSYAAYLNQSFYKWTFTVHAIPQSQIRPYYIPISRGWSEEGRGAKGHAFFPFTIHGKKSGMPWS